MKMKNLKLIGIIALAFLLGVVCQALASYLTSPEGLKYPNPGHYPGEIGPGTFTCAGETNCFWKFPGNLKVTKNMEVNGNLDVDGDLTVDGDLHANRICLQGECIASWDDLFVIITGG